MTRTRSAALAAVLVLLCAAPAWGRTIASHIQPIATSDGTDVTAASPMPVTLGAATSDVNVAEFGGVAYVAGPLAPALSISVTQDTTGAWTVGTELPAAAALTDADANPTVPGVGSYLMGWDNGGGVWGRVRQNAGRMEVDLDLFGGSQLTLGSQTSASSIPVVQSQPNGLSANGALAAANQADGITIAATATRANILIQSSGTTACLVAIGAATGGTDGVILAGGTADDDGTGGLLTTESTEAIYIYDLSGAGTCKYRYIQEVW